jgi:signal transduction histidine kinase
MADPEELAAVLLGLAAAARRAMPEGGTLTLAAALEEVASTAGHHLVGLRPGRYIRFSVSDTGTHLGNDKQAVIGAREATPYGPATEFDLALARTFADQVGGALVREVGPRAGSTAVLWVPVAEASGAAEMGETEA